MLKKKKVILSLIIVAILMVALTFTVSAYNTFISASISGTETYDYANVAPIGRMRQEHYCNPNDPNWLSTYYLTDRIYEGGTCVSTVNNYDYTYYTYINYSVKTYIKATIHNCYGYNMTSACHGIAY